MKHHSPVVMQRLKIYPQERLHKHLHADHVCPVCGRRKTCGASKRPHCDGENVGVTSKTIARLYEKVRKDGAS